jgi:MOSC domain-containing protein
MIRVSGLFIYPVKSCRGIALDRAEVAATGFAHDREWLVVDRHGVFMTQRDWPGLARVEVSVVPDGIELAADGMARLAVAAPGPGASPQRVVIWRDECEAAPAGRDAAQWFSELLGTRCRLVRMPPSTLRQVDQHFATAGDQVGFADGFPFLLLSEASLAELNRRLEEPLPMDRFRPNIVVAGCAPHAEDGWSRIVIGGLGFRVVKPCARCVITTTDQATGARGREPLRTLATYRLFDGKVLFGQNLVHEGRGTIQVGDECVMERPAPRPENRPPTG